MKFNDMIFKEMIKRGYSLEGKTRVWNISASKLWYLTPEQVDAYFKLENAGHYGKVVFDEEIGLLQKHMPEIIDKVLHGTGVNLIDVGSGDGRKAVIALEHLKGKARVRYCPIDISPHMIKKALDRVGKLNLGDVVECHSNIADFDNLYNIVSYYRCNEFRQSFLLFLQCTMSNFETHEILYKLAGAMDDGDYVLIGVPLRVRTPEEYVNLYKIKEIDEWLSLVPQQLGFDRGDLEFDVKFKHNRIENSYIVRKGKMINFHEHSIEFKKGDKILVSVSYRLSQDDIEKALKLYFRDYNIYPKDSGTWALVLCRK